MDIHNSIEKELLKHDLWFWAKKMRMIKNHPWSFVSDGLERTYLKQIYRERSKDIIIVKGRQVEMSEFAVNKSIQFCTENPKTTLLYTFPTTDLCATFGNQRIHEAIFDSPQLTEMLYNDGSIFTRKFKNGSYFYLRTAFGGGDKARSIAADFLVCDEYQDFDARSKSDVPARDVLRGNLDHSKYKYNITFGTPKLKDTHFENLWNSSTMNHWHVVCQQCHKHQPLTLSNIINWDDAWERDALDIVYYGCIFCRAPIDRYDPKNTYWKSLHNAPDNLILKGYHVSQLLVPHKTASDILRVHGTKNILGNTARGFYNEVMGHFYAGSDQPFNEQVLEFCYKTDETLLEGSNTPTYMGIDWGNTSTVCIIKYHNTKEEDLAQIIYACKLPQQDCDEQLAVIYDLMQRFSVEMVVADIGYGRYECGKLIQKYPGRAYACRYSPTREPQLLNWDYKTHTVTVDRNQSLDRLVDRAERGHSRAGGLMIPRDHKAQVMLPQFLQEMKNVVAVVNYNQTVYERIGSGDHFTHALNYAIIAAQKQTSFSMYSPRTQGVRLGMGAMRGTMSSGFRPGANRPGNGYRRR